MNIIRQNITVNIIVSDSETDVCVLSSILHAVDLGYCIAIGRDCVCSAFDESHDAMLGLYDWRFGVQWRPRPGRAESPLPAPDA